MVVENSCSVNFNGVLSVKQSWSKIKSQIIILILLILRRMFCTNIVYLVFPCDYESTKLLVVASESHAVGFLVILVINS